MNSEMRIKWFMYTVCIGLLPISLRFLLTVLGADIPSVSISDVIAFGFVLHISMLNEIEHVIGQKVWKTTINGISIVAIFAYGAFSCALMMHESGVKLDMDTFENIAFLAAAVSFLISLSVFCRPNQISGVENAY